MKNVTLVLTSAELKTLSEAVVVAMNAAGKKLDRTKNPAVYDKHVEEFCNYRELLRELSSQAASDDARKIVDETRQSCSIA